MISVLTKLVKKPLRIFCLMLFIMILIGMVMVYGVSAYVYNIQMGTINKADYFFDTQVIEHEGDNIIIHKTDMEKGKNILAVNQTNASNNGVYKIINVQDVSYLEKVGNPTDGVLMSTGELYIPNEQKFVQNPSNLVYFNKAPVIPNFKTVMISGFIIEFLALFILFLIMIPTTYIDMCEMGFY